MAVEIDMKLEPCPAETCDGEAYAHTMMSALYGVSCSMCSVSGPAASTPEKAGETWNYIALAGERARTEQMEADCKAVCPICKVDATIPPVRRDDEKWKHVYDAGDVDIWSDCLGHEIREAFRASEAEEVDGG